MHLLLILAYRSAVQDSTLCAPALLMFVQDLRTLPEMAFEIPPDVTDVLPGPENARKLQHRMDSAHAFSRNQLQKAGVRQKRIYDMRAKCHD